ncbi:MAG TPA: hypothetical protein RMH85_18955 [Polyangiaceae bacterium LLY-WYZ-15_(1-7)]|nr:hypothetical protein [Myxococcales bacterium]MAT29477.1 hypothetical protein [Sandaracinus sp.]HJK90559.1 hypothetical protein [Polyangiaceae bacterium LLY-WYZ-15_(1-7)]MBJ70645.1 hypothetical protein [Sandaracinus sp.]HJL05089.1 hypothetical protein [Polyangiaceae bacterium LLY-WYZ-15_(1-7)]
MSRFFFASVCSLLFTASAFADAPANRPGETPEDLAAEAEAFESLAQVIVQEGGQPVQQQPAQQEVVYESQPQQPPPPQQVRLQRQTSVYLSVPFHLTDTDVFRPGFGFHGRFGWEFGYIVPEANIGWALNLVDLPTSDENIQTIFLTLGARVQFLNVSNVVPFVAAGFRMSWFSLYDEFGATSDWTFEPGVTAQAGVAIELSQSFGLEFGIMGHVIFPVVNEVFVDGAGDPATQVLLQPYGGLTLYY